MRSWQFIMSYSGSTKVQQKATELSRQHTPILGTRTLDVLHVASAQILGMRSFATYDERQSALAKAVGFRVVRP